ncbi:MAG: hypothetical protein WAL03_13485, partial [Pseudolabrys sp.]
TAAMDSLKTLDPNRPIREADKCERCWLVRANSGQNQKGRQLRRHHLMNDFSSRIAAGEICPGFSLGIKPLYPAVLIGHLPVPECAKSAVR